MGGHGHDRLLGLCLDAVGDVCRIGLPVGGDRQGLAVGTQYLLVQLVTGRPGIEIGAGLRRQQAVRDTALVFSVGIPLLTSDRNQGRIAAAEALRDGAEAQRIAALVNARAQLFRNHRELLDLRQQVSALRERALPQIEAALKKTEYAYERGRYSYLELVDAQRELVAVRDSLIDAATAYHLTLIEIERLSGLSASR